MRESSSHRFPAPAGLLAGRGGNIGLPPRHAERGAPVVGPPGGTRANTLAVASPVDYKLTDVRGIPAPRRLGAAAEIRVPSERGGVHCLQTV